MLLSSPTLGLLLLANWALATAKANSEALEPRGLKRHEHAAEKRAACNRDNVLRALLANSASATPFCTSFLGVTQSTVYVSVPTSTTTSITPTVTTTVTSFPADWTPYILPTYLFSYPTASRISSACSCLSIPVQTITSSGQPTITQTSTATIPLTAPCATESLYQGAYKFSSPATNAYEYKVGPLTQGAYPDTAVANCCVACNYFAPYRGNSGPSLEGYFGDCIGWRVAADRSCTYFLQGPPGDGYLGSLCNVAGFQPGTLAVNQGQYPLAVGGQGQCASSFTVVQG